MLTESPTLSTLLENLERKLYAYSPELARTFVQCYPNTLQTTTEVLKDGEVFVLTGDIPAMWLRDSTAQLRPYIALVVQDINLQKVFRGLIRRQARYISIDPYANAFNREPNGHGHQNDRTSSTSPWVWERKYELDSLCYPVQLCQDYWLATHDASIFDATVYQMFKQIVETMRCEQYHDRDSSYFFERPLEECNQPSDTLPFDGKGTPTNFTGMVWSGFRPSDDACKFGYHLPSNMFAVVVLGYLSDFARRFYQDTALAEEASRLQAQIKQGIETFGIVDVPGFGSVYAYETDGYGNFNLMDDANVPSLLSAPYLGFCQAEDRLYRNTRAFVLSRSNPYYFEGKYARGIGSPHTPDGYIWPISLITQGLTSTDPQEQANLIEMLCNTTAGTFYMHESFHPDDPTKFTRPWFAWANSLFGQFIVSWLESLGVVQPQPYTRSG